MCPWGIWNGMKWFQEVIIWLKSNHLTIKLNLPYIGNGIFFSAFSHMVLDIPLILFLTEISSSIEAKVLRWSENSFSKTSYEIKENHSCPCSCELWHWCELQSYWKTFLKTDILLWIFRTFRKHTEVY